MSLFDNAVSAGGALARARLKGLKRLFRLRVIMPRTLFGRSLLIIVLPVLITQSITAVYFYRQHWEHMTSRLAYAVAGELALVIDLMEEGLDRAERDALFDQMVQSTEMTLTFQEGVRLERRPRVPGHWILQGELEWALDGRVRRPYAITPQVMDRWAEIQIQLRDGVLVALVPRDRLFSATSQVIMVLLWGSGLILIVVALLFMRNQIRPLRRLAIAAENFGKGREVARFHLSGAREVRQAGRAFIGMRDRIQRQIDQRTEMLSGVSHDLRTPLTRMRLQLALMGESPDTKELAGDIDDMERMIEAYLAFARDGSIEKAVPLDLTELVDDVATNARRQGATVSFRATKPVWIIGRPHALRRCIANLVSNAVRHGTKVWISLGADRVAATVTVDDDGPGIPADEREAAFRPFHRLDPARRSDTGGAGLGLTIARDIARIHGGDIDLSDAPQGRAPRSSPVAELMPHRSLASRPWSA